VKPALFTPAAEADVEEAFEWYEAQRPGLGNGFQPAIDVAVAAVENQPEAYAFIHRNTRHTLLPRFPDCRVLEQNVVVVPCIHGKRQPTKWRSR
jgi:toxin ParE1/3/4